MCVWNSQDRQLCSMIMQELARLPTQVEQRVLRECRRCCTVYSSPHNSSSRIPCNLQPHLCVAVKVLIFVISAWRSGQMSYTRAKYTGPSCYHYMFVWLFIVSKIHLWLYSAHEANCDFKPVHCPNNPDCPVMLNKVCLLCPLAAVSKQDRHTNQYISFGKTRVRRKYWRHDENGDLSVTIM